MRSTPALPEWGDQSEEISPWETLLKGNVVCSEVAVKGKNSHADPRVHVGKQGAGEAEGAARRVYAGDRASKCVRMDACR